MSKHLFTVFVAVVIGFSLLLYLFTFQVRSNQVAMVLRFGDPVKTPKPGFHFRWPWPIDEVRTFDNRLHVQEGRFEEMVTRDQYNVNAAVCVGWRVDEANLEQFNRTFGGVEKAVHSSWKELESIIRHNFKSTMSQHNLTDMVTVRKDALKYDDFEAEVVKRAAEDAAATFGIKVVLVKIKRLELPQSVTEKVYASMKAEREKETAAITTKGQEEANRIRKNAESQKNQIIARAKAEKRRIIGQGEAEAAKHYDVFEKHPDLAVYLRKIDALSETTKKTTTLIVDTTTSPFTLFAEQPPKLKSNGGTK